jgi:hypothetical protein
MGEPAGEELLSYYQWAKLNNHIIEATVIVLYSNSVIIHWHMCKCPQLSPDRLPRSGHYMTRVGLSVH